MTICTTYYLYSNEGFEGTTEAGSMKEARELFPTYRVLTAFEAEQEEEERRR